MSTESLDTSVGARLWYQGSVWTVVELDGSTALDSRSATAWHGMHAGGAKCCGAEI